MQENETPVRIPQPMKLPFFGNIFNVDINGPVLCYIKLSKKYGPIFKLRLINRDIVVISSYDLINEVCDETRFEKTIVGILSKIGKALTGNGLITTYTYDPIWAKAHNILMACFGKQAMQRYLDGMLMNADRLVSKWASTHGIESVNVSDDMVSLALDTIGICGFDYDFNLLYRGGTHPFIDAFSYSFRTAMKQIRELPFESHFRPFRQYKFRKNKQYIVETVDRIIRTRREKGPSGGSRSDMLSYMLWGVDESTGERLDDVNIRNQVITFLTVGHDTAAGLMAFAIYALTNNPDILVHAYEEVDRVLGTDPAVKPTYEQIHNLPYLTQVLKEVLRLWPVAPAFMLQPLEDTLIGGKYLIHPNNQIVVLLPQLHRDPAIWGPKAEEFNPDNFSPEAEAQRPANAYKPFGNGMRACIARDFAMQEALVAISMILKNFQLVKADENYKLNIKEVNLFKPDDFRIKVFPRK